MISLVKKKTNNRAACAQRRHEITKREFTQTRRRRQLERQPKM